MYLPGVGPSRAKLLREEMGIHTCGDLALYFPFKHLDRTRVYYIHELTADMPFVQIRGRILSYEVMGEGRKQRLVGHFTDGHGLIDLVWFNATKWVREQYREEKEYIVFGRPQYYPNTGRFSITHPEIDDAAVLTLSSMGMQPYYTIPVKAAKRGLSSRTIERLTNTLFHQ